jgi:hypothetical protein
MSTIEQEVWTKIDEHFKENYGDNELWSTVIAPYLERFVSAEASTREKIECVDELINHLHRLYLDSKNYGFIPGELRRFLESSGETTILLGYRLTESVRSLEKITQLREALRDYGGQPSQRKENHELNELLETIELIINGDD